MSDLYLPVSVIALKRRQNRRHNPSFEASKGWICQFKERHDSSYRKRKSLCQRLLSQVEGKISSFYSKCTKFIKTRKYSFPLTGNIDELLYFLTWYPRDHSCRQVYFRFRKETVVFDCRPEGCC